MGEVRLGWRQTKCGGKGTARRGDRGVKMRWCEVCEASGQVERKA